MDALAADLADTLADWVQRTSYGRGIAAPQIGVPVRVVYLNFDGPELLVNPVITARSAETWEPWDACLSFSVEIFCRVRRATWVDVTYQSPGGASSTIRAEGELSELLQHEIDHLDGILAVDRMTSVDTLCMRSEFERRYRDGSPYRQ
jgi:peptide deformylase